MMSWWLPDHWPDDVPDSLQDTCVAYCINNLEKTLCTWQEKKELYCLREGITIAQEVCQCLLKTYADEHFIDDKFAHIFHDPSRTKLRGLDLQDSNITDVGLTWLLTHKPHHLNISGCVDLSQDAVVQINKQGQNLTSLFIGNRGTRLFCNLPMSDSDDDNDGIEPGAPVLKNDSSCQKGDGGVSQTFGKDFILDCPNLKALSIHSLDETDCQAHAILTLILDPLQDQLNYLDLSSCIIELEFLGCLHRLHNLTTLILYDVHLNSVASVFAGIAKLKKLRALDLSQGGEQPMFYTDPEEHLSYLVSNLQDLTHLDLAGTNLAGFQKLPQVAHTLRQAQQPMSEDPPIPGLEGRHLKFLGLLNCAYDACNRAALPAAQVSGDDNEGQVIASIQCYLEKESLLLLGLNNLFHLCKYLECHDQKNALQAILAAMKRHPFSKTIQISGSASLFYISKGSEKNYFCSKIKRMIVRAILDGMEYHMDEPTMLRNGCLTLCHFKIPQDVLFQYERVVTLLLKMVGPRTPSPEEFVQRIGIYLLNSLACQVEGREKQLVGDLGAIATMLEIITDRLRRGMCDEVMEIAWSTMWNVTDETPVNCERFIELDGMDLFLNCLEKFPDKEELLRNMMGLLGNVAEVEYLRPRLMQSEYVSVFSDLLDSISDGIEVSYNACGVLAHMMADGSYAWDIDHPSRHTVSTKMVAAISRWTLNTKRNINYRSFEPILRLLPKDESPPAQHWAVWALCNLTKMYRSKYCPLVEKEKGLQLLEEMIQSPRTYSEIRALAQQVVDRCYRLRSDPEYDSNDEDQMEEGDALASDDEGQNMDG